MVKAGEPVDRMVESLIPLLEKGDVIIDGGNSLFTDTQRRMEYVESTGLLYVGTGVSGGEEGARNGPSIMPGGSPEAWQVIRRSPGLEDIWQVHFAVEGGKENNSPDTFIANTDETCEGKWLKLSVQPDGTFTVVNSRNNFSKTYKPQS